MIKGIFSSSIPTSSNVVKEEEQDEELDADAQRDIRTFEEDQNQDDQEQDEVAHADAVTDIMEPPSSVVNKTPKVVNGEPAGSSAVKGSGKKNRSKDVNDARRIKNQKKKERKQKKRDASAVESSAMESSVMGEEIEARGMEGRGGNSAVAADEDRSFISPDLSRTMMNLFGDEPAKGKPADAPKPKKAKKSKGSSKQQSNTQALEVNGLASQVPRAPEPVEEETQDVQTLIRKEQLAKRKEEKAQKTAPSVESESSGSNRRSHSAELSLVEKIKKAKRKARSSPRKPSQESIAALQDEDDPDALLHQPLTPALTTHSTPQSPNQPTAEDIAEAEAEAQIQSNACSTGEVDPDPEGNDEEPVRPSKKALGKRKASNTGVEPNAKRKKSKGTAEVTPKLTTYGFVAGSAPSEEASLRDQSPPLSPDTTMLAQGAASLYVSQMETERTSPVPEVPVSSSIAIASSQQRRPTPAFTPVNPRRPLAAVVIPAPATDPYKLPPSSQPHPESELELPQKAPTSTERRKRRLPTGEAESSKANGNGKSTRGRKSVGANRAVKSMTPKSSASKAKTPKSKTPKALTGSQATPASKGHRLPASDVEEIDAAVKSYKEDNDLEEVDFNAIVQGDVANKEIVKQFWAYMYEQVPDVPKTKLQNHCRRNFHNFEARGTWTEEADQDLRDAYERNPGKWKQIGAELNRFSEDCRDRWRNYLICGDKQKKATWDKEEEEQLRDVVEELLALIREGEDREPDDFNEDDYNKLDWVRVSAMMGHTRSRLQCSTKWKKIQEREDAGIEDPVAFRPISKAPWRLEDAEKNARKMKARDKLDLLYQIRETKAGSEGKIPWYQIQQELGLKHRKMALRVCYRNLKEHVPDSDEMKLQDVVSTLIDLYEAAAPAEPPGFRRFFSPARYNKSEKRKSSSRSVSRDGDGNDENDSDQGPSKLKKRRTSNAKSGKDNGEGPSTQQPRLHLAKGRKAAMLSEMDHDNDGTPQKKSAKKLRSRMKGAGQKESQETATSQAESADDLGAAFQAAKSSQAKSPRVAKKPLMAARTSRSSKRLSAYRAYESDSDEEPVAAEHPTSKPTGRSEREEQADEDAQSDKEMPQHSEEQPYLDLPRPRQEVPESDINMGDAPPPANGYSGSDYDEEDEDYPSNTHDQESIDLDAGTHNETIKGLSNGMENASADDESDDYDRIRARSESIDLDNTPRPGLLNGTHDEDSDDESAVGLGPSGGNRNSVLRSPSAESDGVSSDASSIPFAIPSLQRRR